MICIVIKYVYIISLKEWLDVYKNVKESKFREWISYRGNIEVE